MKPSVCIIRADQAFKVDKELLQAHNLTTRSATDCLADLILSNAGLTVAYILLKPSIHPFTEKERARVAETGSGFRNAFFLLAQSQAVNGNCSSSTAEQEALSTSASKACMITYSTETNLTERALDLFQNLGCATSHDPAEEQIELAHSSAALQSILRGIPGVPLSGKEASSLQLCGSVRDIANSTVREIMDLSELDRHRAEAIVAFLGS